MAGTESDLPGSRSAREESLTASRGRVIAVYVFCCLVWGSTWMVIKVGLRDLPPFHFAATRMALACLLMAPVAFAPGTRRPNREEGVWIAICGFLQIGVSYAFIFTASQWIPSSLAALLFCTFPIWVGLFGHWLLPNEPMTARTVAASALGLAGVGVIQGPGIFEALRARPGPLLIGGLCVLGSAVVSAITNVLNKKHFALVSPYRNVWGQTLVGAAFLVALALVFERDSPMRWTSGSLFALGYLAVFGTAMSFAGLFWLIPRVPVAVIGTIPLSDTAIAVLLGVAILGETLSARVLAGGLLILLGVVMAAMGRRSPEVVGV
ncbi:MAG TPA: EamA family transporter [Thermoanaerobaculia bacterium]|nr:EamA family transporter [Thermoanaerobaculia bacterium]